jgi:histidinol dehydrogenase
MEIVLDEIHRILKEFSKNKISANVVTTFSKIIQTKHLQNLLIIADSHCADFDIFLVQVSQ